MKDNKTIISELLIPMKSNVNSKKYIQQCLFGLSDIDSSGIIIICIE